MAHRYTVHTATKSLNFVDLAKLAEDYSGDSSRAPTVNGLYSSIAFLYRCVDVRANLMTAIPWAVRQGENELYNSTGDDLPPAPYPWFADLRTLLWQSEAALTLCSKAYLHKVKAGQRIIGVRWLQPDTMTPVWGKEPAPVAYKRQLPGSTQEDTLPAEDVAYLWLRGIGETVPRSAPAEAASIAAGVLYNTDQFVSNYFKRGAIKATLLGVPADTPPQAKQELKAWYDRVLSGIKNAWGAQVINSDAITPVVIGSGIDELSNNTLTNEKREDIATALGVPHSLVLSNAANFATAEADRLNFYETTILPEAYLIAESLNRQIFRPLGLTFVWMPQELAIYQEDEEQRATSYKTYIDAGMKPSIAAQMLGLNLPEGITPDMLDPEEPSSNPSTLLPVGAPALLPGPVSTEGGGLFDEEVRKLRRWAKGKAAPDVTKFVSLILSDDDKRAALGDSDAAMPPFSATHKAMQLLLDEDDEDDAERVRRKLEKQGSKDIADGLEDMGKDVAKLAKQGTPSAAELNGLRKNPVLVQGVQRLLRASVEAGVSFGIDALGNLATDVDWKLVNKDAVAWARDYAGTLIDQIDDATLDATRNAIANWAESGAPLPDLIDQLAPWYGEERASRIAVTETTRSFAEANRQAYAASGVVAQMEWRTAVDELVCPICGPLHEQQRDLDESFGEDVFGEEMFTPPAHPNCRCIVSPVVRR